MPTPRSPVARWSPCSPPATPASPCPMKPSTRASPTSPLPRQRRLLRLHFLLGWQTHAHRHRLALPVTRQGEGFERLSGECRLSEKDLNYRDRYYPLLFRILHVPGPVPRRRGGWREWNARNIRYLSTIQSSDGSFPGNKGASFNTAGALLSLALNYRFLPIYEK